MRALHNGNALAFQARVAGSIPAARSRRSRLRASFLLSRRLLARQTRAPAVSPEFRLPYLLSFGGAFSSDLASRRWSGWIGSDQHACPEHLKVIEDGSLDGSREAPRVARLRVARPSRSFAQHSKCTPYRRTRALGPRLQPSMRSTAEHGFRTRRSRNAVQPDDRRARENMIAAVKERVEQRFARWQLVSDARQL